MEEALGEAHWTLPPPPPFLFSNKQKEKSTKGGSTTLAEPLIKVCNQGHVGVS